MMRARAGTNAPLPAHLAAKGVERAGHAVQQGNACSAGSAQGVGARKGLPHCAWVHRHLLPSARTGDVGE